MYCASSAAAVAADTDTAGIIPQRRSEIAIDPRGLFCLTVVYTICRAHMMVEMFVSLREVPVDAYRVPQWSQHFPSFGQAIQSSLPLPSFSLLRCCDCTVLSWQRTGQSPTLFSSPHLAFITRAFVCTTALNSVLTIFVTQPSSRSQTSQCYCFNIFALQNRRSQSSLCGGMVETRCTKTLCVSRC